jgi:hypothetical protein
MLADVPAWGLQISFCLGNDDRPVRHRRRSGSKFQVVEDLIHSAALASLGLSQSSADACYGVEMTSDLLIGGRIKDNGLGLSFDGQDEWSARLPHALHQPYHSLIFASPMMLLCVPCSCGSPSFLNFRKRYTNYSESWK